MHRGIEAQMHRCIDDMLRTVPVTIIVVMTCVVSTHGTTHGEMAHEAQTHHMCVVISWLSSGIPGGG